MITPAAAAAWVGQTRLSLRPGCLGLPSPLHPQGVFLSSIVSLSLSDKCLPSVDQLDLREGTARCCGDLGDSSKSLLLDIPSCINPFPWCWAGAGP